jgi:hypothetical protein
VLTSIHRLADVLFGPGSPAAAPAPAAVKAALVQALEPRTDPKSRLHAFVLAAGGCAAVGMFPLFLAFELRKHLPLPAGALMTWPGVEAPPFLIAAAAFLFALPLGVFAAWRGQFWPTMKWPCLVFVCAALLANLLSLGSGVVVYPDRAVIKSGLPTRTRTLLFTEAQSIQTACDVVTRRKRDPVAGVRYSVVFRSGETLDLSDVPTRDSRKGMQAWFRQVDRLDSTAFATLPHQPVGDSVPGCVASLRDQFDPFDFAAAARILGLSALDRAPVILPPHEAWRSGTQR